MLQALTMSRSVSEDIQVNLVDLRQQLVGGVTLALVAASSVIMWLSLRINPFPALVFALMAGALIVGSFVRFLNARYPHLGRRVFVWGIIAFMLVAMWLLPETWIPFAGVGFIFFNALFIIGGELATAGAIAALAVWMVSAGWRNYPLVELLLTLGFAVTLAWLLVNIFYTALAWAWNMQQRADELLREAQDRQAALNRTLKSLELTTYQLERANHDLFLAHRQAEEARRMKEHFAANISHELRTPLNLILGFSEMMYRSPQVYGEVHWTDTLRGDVYQVYRNSRHLLDLIDDILDLSRFEMAGFTLKKEPTDLGALLQGAVSIAADLFRERPVQLDLVAEPALPLLEIDRTRIRQVVLNLLSNAQKFTEHGVVRVEAKRCADEVVVSVTDTGSGIPSDKLAHIFDEFYQVDGSVRRNHGGAGLGLAISKQFVQAHDGRIWVESQPGVGSTFSFCLPIPDTITPLAPTRSTEERAPAWHEARCILVVDPDPAVANLLRRNVEGYDVVQVNDLASIPGQVLVCEPQIIVENVLPGESRVNELCQLLPSPVPIFECSLPSQAWMASNLSVRASLTKPFTAQQLLHQIDSLSRVHDVLVVDDDPGFGQLVERILATINSDIEVRNAYDGAEGLRAMRVRRPDMVLLDLIMPGMDGFQMLSEMHRDPLIADVPVVLCTVGSYVEDRLMMQGGRIVLDRPGGLHTSDVLRCLQAVVGILQPTYAGGG